MKKINIGLIGFGTVGTGVVKTLLSKKKILAERTGILLRLKRIADKDLRPRKNLRIVRQLLTKDIDSVLQDREIDIIVELIGGIRPAKEIIAKSLTFGKHVVTANKALLAEHGKDLFTVAAKFGTLIGFEASVGGGIPIINALRKNLVPNNILLLYGILNGTSNFILSRMSDENCSFDEALKAAQKMGIAERNPKLDISGADSCHKLSILALLGFGLSVKPDEIYTEGIQDVDPMDIQYAKSWGYAVKLLGIAKKDQNNLDLRVHPTLIPVKSILASVKDENNAIFVKGDMVGDQVFYGKGAGSLPTASSVVSDIIDIAQSVEGFRKSRSFSKLEFHGGVKRVARISDLVTRYYVRFSAIDRPGVLAGISSILAENRISIATVTQKERKKGQPVPIVMLTHNAREGNMARALKRIDKLPFIRRRTVKLRIER